MNPLQELILLYKFGRNFLKLGRLRSLRASLRGDMYVFQQAGGANQGQYPIPCGGTGTYYSMSKPIRYASSMGVFVLMNSPSNGNCNTKIQMQQSYIDPAAANVNASDPNWVIGDGVPDIYTNLNDGTTPVAHIKTLTLVPMKHCRLIITGLGSNASDVTLFVVLFSQELIA